MDFSLNYDRVTKLRVLRQQAVQHSKEIIAAEMKKKDKKKLGFK